MNHQKVAPFIQDVISFFNIIINKIFPITLIFLDFLSVYILKYALSLTNDSCAACAYFKIVN